MFFLIVFFVCNFFAMEIKFDIAKVKSRLNDFQDYPLNKKAFLDIIFANTIGLSPLKQHAFFDQEKFFPWTEEQKKMMTFLVNEGANPNPNMKRYDCSSDSVLRNLFSLPFDPAKKNILKEKIGFMICDLGANVNIACPINLDTIPISYAKKIIREDSLISYNEVLKNHFNLGNNNEGLVDYTLWLSSLAGKNYMQESYEFDFPAIVDLFCQLGGDLSQVNRKNRNLLYYVIKGWQLSWNVDFLKKLIEHYQMPVIIDTGNNTLVHAMAKSPFFFFEIKEDLESCPDFNCKWSLFSYICQYLSFSACNIKNHNGQLPHEITLNKYQDFLNTNKTLSHIILYAYEKYFSKI